MVRDLKIHPKVSFDVNPTSLQVEENLLRMGLLEFFMQAGARIHEPGCNGCIGMGQAPSTGGISLRTVPRNFPGRSGAENDKVYLCSPETATASALMGVITDPRTLSFEYPHFEEPKSCIINDSLLVPPPEDGSDIELVKGPNIAGLPELLPLPSPLEIPVMIKVGDNISTDEIMPAGANVLPWRSNIPEISKFVFSAVDNTFHDRAILCQEGGFAIVGGENYGQGSSREHAALAPRFLGLRVVIAKSFARIHWQNLVDYGIVPLIFDSKEDYDHIDQDDTLFIPNIKEAIKNQTRIDVENKTKGETYVTDINLSDRQKKAVLAGSFLNLA
ncbi:MAG TPA: aconitase family protein [Candidatus Lokiarchaeia archaeon]|nr:aconitase family protein [Candidatus Lokiarchaeia archaeon]